MTYRHYRPTAYVASEINGDPTQYVGVPERAHHTYGRSGDFLTRAYWTTGGDASRSGEEKEEGIPPGTSADEEDPSGEEDVRPIDVPHLAAHLGDTSHWGLVVSPITLSKLEESKLEESKDKIPLLLDMTKPNPVSWGGGRGNPGTLDINQKFELNKNRVYAGYYHSPNGCIEGLKVTYLFNEKCENVCFDVAMRLALGWDTPELMMECSTLLQTLHLTRYSTPWSAILIANRPFHKVSSEVGGARLYLYTEDKAAIRRITKLRKAWDRVLPITVVDPRCVSGSSTTSWSCHGENAWDMFKKTLKEPADDAITALFPYFLQKDGDKIKLHESEECQIVFYEGTGWCNPCPTSAITNIRILTIDHHYVNFICLIAIEHIVCWVVDSPHGARLDEDTVNKWDLCLFVQGSASFPAAARALPDRCPDGVTPLQAYGLVYTLRVQIMMGYLEQMIKTLLPDTCIGPVKCLRDDIVCLVQSLLEDTTPKASAPDLCEVSHIRTRLHFIIKRFMELYSHITQVVGQINLSITLCDSNQVLHDAYCKMTRIVIPWLHISSRTTEASYNARTMVDTGSSCDAPTVILHPLLVKERMRLQLLSKVPHLMKGSDMDIVKNLEHHVLSNPSDESASIAKNFISVSTSIMLKDRMIDMDIGMSEIGCIESDVCTLLDWASKECVLNNVSRVNLQTWVQGVLNLFRKNLAQTNGDFVRNALQARKSRDKQLAMICRDSMKKARELVGSLTNLLTAIGVNPLLSEIAGEEGQGVLNGLATLDSLRLENDRVLTCSVAKHMNVGAMVLENVFESMERLSLIYSQAPDGISNPPQIAYPYNIYEGANDGHMYLPVWGDSSFVRVSGSS